MNEFVQVFASTCAVAYNNVPSKQWEPLSRIILEAMYEAILHFATINAAMKGNDGAPNRGLPPSDVISELS